MAIPPGSQNFMGFRNSSVWRFVKGDIAQLSIFDALYYAGILRLIRPAIGGLGVIFMFHRIGDPEESFAPMFTPASFIELCIRYARNAGWQIVTLDDMHRRLTGEADAREPFVCFTFDDGYRDNITLGLPIFERHKAPFAVYVPTGTPDRSLNPWWAIFDRLVSEHEEILLEPSVGQETVLRAGTVSEKRSAYWQLWRLAFPDASEHAYAVGRLYHRYSIDPANEMERITLGWKELREAVSHPLITIGSHTVSHPVLPELNDSAAEREIADGTSRLESELGRKVSHFAYPFGFATARDAGIVSALGLKSAVTTMKGNVFAEAKDHRFTLPRRSFENLHKSPRTIRNSLFGADNLLDIIRGRPRTMTASLLPWSVEPSSS